MQFKNVLLQTIDRTCAFPLHKYFLTKFDFVGVLDVFADALPQSKKKSKIMFSPYLSDLVTGKDAFSLHFNGIQIFFVHT